MDKNLHLETLCIQAGYTPGNGEPRQIPIIQIKELSHILGSIVFEGSALNNGNLTGFAVAGLITSLDAQGFSTKIFSICVHLV